ncbi:hypothetical protein V2J93_17070 [Pseudomonas alliivorans]|nr:hypothetical protein [Pseudomonas alliivorans]
MEVVFLADSVSAEVWGNNKIRVVTEVEPEELLDSLDVEDRVKGLDGHEVITAMGINKTLNALNEEELAGWVSSDECDPTDLLNAIGEKFILEWLADAGPDDCNY